MSEPMANEKTGRERYPVVVWDDPEVIEAIKAHFFEARVPVGVAVRDFLRKEAGLPPFPAGLPDTGEK